MKLEFDKTALFDASARAETWVKRTSGDFSASLFGKENGIENADLRNQVLDDLLRREIIETVGRRHGIYCLVNSSDDLYDWMSVDEEYYPLLFPLGLSDLCRVSPGNLVLVAARS